MDTLIGVDIGQKRDPTAICVALRESRKVGQKIETHYTVRYLGRVPLGTPYPKIARRLAEIVLNARARSGSSPSVSVDATGVGQPVVDILSEQVQGATLIPVYFTYGDRRTEREEDGRRVISLGKGWLVSLLQALLQTSRLHLPRTQEAHDDLVTALGLAVQGQKRHYFVGRAW